MQLSQFGINRIQRSDASIVDSFFCITVYRQRRSSAGRGRRDLFSTVCWLKSHQLVTSLTCSAPTDIQRAPPTPAHLHPIYSLFLIQLTSAVYPGRLRAYNNRIEESINTNYSTYIQAFISSCLDYCNSLLYGVSDNLIRRVQSALNAAARLLTGAGRRDHISPVLRQLHCLPVQRRVLTTN